MTDRDIAAIVADLRANSEDRLSVRWARTPFPCAEDILAVLDDWQRQADEIARRQQGWYDFGRALTERDAALDEVEALRAIIRGIDHLRDITVPSELRAALDRALAGPTKET